jgi:S-formylglutathione hydrolase FrmB
VPTPGYHERVFRSAESLSREQGMDGSAQRYGVYLPAGWREGRPAPLQLWLHWRGGDAHAAGNVIPSLFDDLGDRYGTIVISPSGRGSSTWYVGKGHADVLEAWADAHRALAIDTTRRYVAGHSMGGWGSFLFTILHPDWFAAALPASPPPTQGAWTGLDFEGCDDLSNDAYSPCYTQANGGDARAQHTLRLLENVRNVPWAMMHGTVDELVPTGGVARQHARLLELGYRNRLYLFHTQEHFGPPVWDQWREGAAYLHRFASTPSPSRVTFIRDMPFERATERELALDFDSAYWLSGLQPADEQAGVASFDGRSLAIPEAPVLKLPEAGGPVAPGQTGPWTMTGLRWASNPLAATPRPANAFEATLTGAKAATLDLAGMRLDPSRTITATITTDRPVTLTLQGAKPAWQTISLAAGSHRLLIG